MFFEKRTTMGSFNSMGKSYLYLPPPKKKKKQCWVVVFFFFFFNFSPILREMFQIDYCFSTGFKKPTRYTWNLMGSHLFINGWPSIGWFSPNLYIENSCFTNFDSIQPLLLGKFIFPASQGETNSWRQQRNDQCEQSEKKQQASARFPTKLAGPTRREWGFMKLYIYIYMVMMGMKWTPHSLLRASQKMWGKHTQEVEFAKKQCSWIHFTWYCCWYTVPFWCICLEVEPLLVTSGVMRPVWMAEHK